MKKTFQVFAIIILSQVILSCSFSVSNEEKQARESEKLKSTFPTMQSTVKANGSIAAIKSMTLDGKSGTAMLKLSISIQNLTDLTINTLTASVINPVDDNQAQLTLTNCDLRLIAPKESVKCELTQIKTLSLYSTTIDPELDVFPGLVDKFIEESIKNQFESMVGNRLTVQLRNLSFSSDNFEGLISY